MADLRKHSATSNLIRFTLKNATTGVGLTGLSSASSGLIISTIADNEATATTYTVAGSTIETITTLGTYAAPTATKCRFKEVDATNHKGLYEFQFADARFSVASAKRLIISATGATNLLDADYEIQLTQIDMYDSVRAGMTALPNAAAEAAGGLYTRGTGAGQIAQDANGNIRANMDTIKTQAVTCAAGVTVLASVGTAATSTAQSGDAFALIGAAGAGLTALGDTRLANLDAAITSRMATYTQPTGFLAATFPTTVASTTNITGGTITTTTNLTNLPAITAGWLTAAGIAASALDGKGDWNIGKTGYALTTAPPTAIENADALLNRDMATGTDSGSPTVRTVRQALRFLRNKWSIAGTALTVTKEDDTTASWTATVSTDAAALPVTGNDPA